jgi:hypothetical protein
MFLYYLFYIPIFFFAWALVFPLQAMLMIKNMKRSLDDFVVKQIVRKEIRFLRAEFRRWGKVKGCNCGLVDRVFDEYSPEILHRLEARYSGVTFDE